MRVLQANEFSQAVKKLPKQQKAAVDTAVNCIVAEPSVGEMKVGDLAGIRV